MIIEFCGLPGTGKTTLARKIESELGFSRVKIKNRRELVFYNFIFFIKHPLKFFIFLYFVIINAGSCKDFYLNFMNLFLQHNAKFQKAKKYKKAVIDQGYYQNAISLFKTSRDRIKIMKYAKHFLKPDKLIFFEIDEPTRLGRLEKRGYGSRQNFSKDYLESWNEASLSNSQTLKNVLDNLEVDYAILHDNSVEEFKRVAKCQTKKIAYLANARIPTEKAHGLQIAKMAESFSSLGCKVTLWLPNRKNIINTSIKEFYNLKFEIDTVKLLNIFYFFEDFSKKIYFPIQRFFFFWQALILMPFAKCDFIYSREITLCFWLQLFGKKTVFEDHEPKVKFKFLYYFFINHIRHKILVAKNLEKIYEESGVDKDTYEVSPNGVDLEEIKEVKADRNIWKEIFGLLPSEKIILYVGHFYEWKGVDVLIAAAEFMTEGKIVLVGGTPEDKERIDKMIKSKNLKNIFLHSFVPHLEALKYIKSADILVLPNTAKEERSAKYTTPIKMFEYMASGVPIVASRIESFQSYLEDKKNSVLFEPDNPQDLAEKIRLLMSDNSLAQNLVMQSLAQAKDYSWKNRAEKILNFIYNN